MEQRKGKPTERTEFPLLGEISSRFTVFYQKYFPSPQFSYLVLYEITHEKLFMKGFRKRNPNISLRKPENTILARLFSFNESAVDEFYTNYEILLARQDFTPDRILNSDETGITTVLNTPKVLAEKKQRQVGQLVPAERGELVTFCTIITATGNSIYIFTRVHYKDHFLKDAPEGSLRLATESGWIDADLFINAIQHLMKLTSCSKENPVLLLCDNHESHISVEAINFSPHSSHKLQPLDVSVFDPFKGKLKTAFNDWHVANAGKTITICQIAELSKLAFYESSTPKNIVHGFTEPGIWPFNKLDFVDEVYQLSSNCRHFPQPQEGDTQLKETTDEFFTQSTKTESKTVSPIRVRHTTPPCTSAVIIKPEIITPYPKAQQKTSKRKSRKEGKSRIFTDTPEKNRLQMLYDQKEEKKRNKEMKKMATQLKNAKKLLGLASPKKNRKKRSRRCEPDLESTSF
ncbi:hypothetical protein JTB14_022284 [Gonioctena quinquepunctata]|nr:hypothetical protein JTB14_022284 [Gonioctena quinquepunctata]